MCKTYSKRQNLIQNKTDVYHCTKGTHFNFLIVWVLEQEGYQKISNVPPFTFCGTMSLFRILIFCLILGFLRNYPPIFFQYYPKFWRWKFENIAVYPNFRRFIRTILSFTEEAETQKQTLSFVPARHSLTLRRYIRSNFRFTEK